MSLVLREEFSPLCLRGQLRGWKVYGVPFVTSYRNSQISICSPVSHPVYSEIVSCTSRSRQKLYSRANRGRPQPCFPLHRSGSRSNDELARLTPSLHSHIHATRHLPEGSAPSGGQDRYAGRGSKEWWPPSGPESTTISTRPCSRRYQYSAAPFCLAC